MILFNRRLLHRFLKAAGLTFLVLVWLILIVDASPAVSALTSKEILSVAGRVAGSIEMALAVAAPFGMALALMELKSSGLLAAFLAAGLKPARLRKFFLAAAAATVIGSALLFETTVRLSRAAAPENTFHLYRDNGLCLWPAAPGPRDSALHDVILFRNDSLQVSRAGEAEWTDDHALLLTGLQPLSGPPLSVKSFRPAPPPPKLFDFPSVADWFGKRSSLPLTLSALNRVILGGILVLITAYVALLTPVSRQGATILAFMVFVPAVFLGMLWCMIWLNSAGGRGYLAEALWLVALGGTIAVLDALFRRRGLRLA